MSNDTREEHAAVWTKLAESLADGVRLGDALEQGKAEARDPRLRAAIAAVGEAVKTGATLSDALAAQPDGFSNAMVAIVRAGEVGGVVDVAARAIADGVAQAACPLPGERAPEGGEPARYWRLFALLLSSGVPLVEALDLLAADTADPALATATQAVRHAVAEGRSMADEMQAFPGLFAPEVCAAIASGEAEGRLDAQAAAIARGLAEGRLDDLPGAGSPSGEGEDTAGRYVRELLAQAVARRATDLHIEPTGDGVGRVRLRIDGVLHAVDPPPAGGYAAVVARLKTMAAMDVAERRLPQARRIVLPQDDGPRTARLSAVPTVRGERLVMRLLDHTWTLPALEDLLPGDQAETVRELCRRPSGLVLCSGPAGAGKTTLLYAILNQLDRDSLSVMSIEEPVEWHIDGVSQIEAVPRIGLSIAKAVRYAFSQDPDVVMIGELRDLETIEWAAKGAMTGHLVLGSLHSASCAAAVRHLLDAGVQPAMFNASLAGLIAVRLVRTLCPECRQPEQPAVEALPARAAHLIEAIPDATFYAPKGCAACSGTGYRGRAGVYEILIVDEGLRRAVTASADETAMHQAAVAAGMTPIFENAVAMAARGNTSLEEVLRMFGADA
ncbi:MAG: Flp pilus assembly complex ATPase component TadA [Candidatus Hydrogenedentes bacterium]|nr:Flp pilus assembly complex ATPase component TadA [Candidatus Hydrogenedentota bacterium]